MKNLLNNYMGLKDKYSSIEELLNNEENTKKTFFCIYFMDLEIFEGGFSSFFSENQNETKTKIYQIVLKWFYDNKNLVEKDYILNKMYSLLKEVDDSLFKYTKIEEDIEEDIVVYPSSKVNIPYKYDLEYYNLRENFINLIEKNMKNIIF